MPFTADDVQALLGRLDERTRTLVDDVGQLKHTLLEGNGVPAITVQVATLNAKVDTLETERGVKRGLGPVWIGILVSAAVGIAGLVAQLAS